MDTLGNERNRKRPNQTDDPAAGGGEQGTANGPISQFHKIEPWLNRKAKDGAAPDAGDAPKDEGVVGISQAKKFEPWLERKAGGGGGGAEKVEIPEGGGAPLDGGVRSNMEGQFGGADFSGVRVHTGGESGRAADGIGARAFTKGSDIHFGPGEYAPGSKEGDRLLGHELTHVVQGQQSGVQAKAAEGGQRAGGHQVSDPGASAEREADAAGDRVAAALHGGEAGEGGAQARQAAPAIAAKLKPGTVLRAPKGGGGGKTSKVSPHPDKTYVKVDAGKYMLKDEYQNKDFCRNRCYAKSYNTAVQTWKAKMLSTPKSKGGLRHEREPNKYWYKDKWYVNEGKDIASIGHENPPVVEHWNDKGSKTTQDVRVKYYNGDGDPAKQLEIQPLSVNSSDGGGKTDRYTFEVSIDFRGP